MQPEYQPSPTLRRITSERQQRAISPVPDYRISIPTPTSRTRRSCFAIPKPILKWLLLCLVISTVLAYIGYALYFNNESISFEEAVLNLKLTPPVAYSDVHLDPKFNSTWDFGRKYGIVIDAGSSGSRAQVYSWKLDPSSSRLINIEKSHSDGEDFQLKTHPGLSSFKPATVGGHIRPLLDFAAKTIPKEKLKQSSVYLFATAGMRMLPVSDQDALLNAICALVRNEYEYQTLGGCNNHFRVITGNLEGIFGWLTVNYLQHAWKDPDPDAPSYGFLDMGGIYEITKALPRKLRLNPRQQ